MVVYVELTEGYGDTCLKLRLIDADEAREPIFEKEVVLTFPDPLAILELVVALSGVVFPEPGEYRLQLFATEELLLDRRLMVVSTEDVDQL